MDADHVAKGVVAAFGAVPLPEMSLHQAQLLDQSMSREISEAEWVETGRLDAGRTWREFTDEELMGCNAALAFFDEPAFVYYLPAFILFALRYWTVSWSHPARSVVGSVVFSLTRREPYSLGRYKQLTSEQRAAVVSFLEFVAEHPHNGDGKEAHAALRDYWTTDEASKPLIVIVP
jgi:hypothetical protein